MRLESAIKKMTRQVDQRNFPYIKSEADRTLVLAVPGVLFLISVGGSFILALYEPATVEVK